MSLAAVVHALARHPRVADALRWLLEAGFRGERRVLREQRCLEAGAVLDLGCGTGVLAGAFAADRYVGIDTDVACLRHAAAGYLRHRFAAMDGRSLAVRGGAFDMVIVGGVIHHLNDMAAAALLGEVRRVLLPGSGRVVLWEDIPTRSRWNVIGRLTHHFDKGGYIREPEHYLELIRGVFPAFRAYPMRSGVCDYLVVVAG